MSTTQTQKPAKTGQFIKQCVLDELDDFDEPEDCQSDIVESYQMVNDLPESDEDDEDEEIVKGLNIKHEDVGTMLNSDAMVQAKSGIKNLSWPQLIRLMEYGDLSDDQMVALIGDTTLDADYIIRKRKQFVSDDGWNPGDYGVYVRLFKRAISKRRVTTTAEGKPVQGTKIYDMFKSLTEVPVSQQELIEKFGVSIHILKQYNRFIKPGWIPSGFKVARITNQLGIVHFYIQRVV